ncbi:MAG: class I SAM-dependent methyltransferase [Planctomycetales bacterium]|nr:class I SAM-dependent methyltransferase [Planctomycetales bacterium]
MSQEDRQKWDARYRQQPNPESGPAEVLTANADLIPRAGNALDVAGGSGRNALWLARRGLNASLVDISAEGLAIARQRAEKEQLDLQFVVADLEHESLPAGPWRLVVQTCFLQRELFPSLIQALEPAGMLVVAQPTRRNRERWTAPPEKYLLDEGELIQLAGPLEIVHFDEAWRENGRYEAWLIARRRGEFSA